MSVIAEAASLPEKFKEESTRIPAAVADLTIATMFLPPVTHSRTALTRYYSRDGVDERIVENLVSARQDAEKLAWKNQVVHHKLRLILDRHQLEEYCSEPEYYQMVLTPSELDEQIATWTEWFAEPNFEVVLSAEPIDILFSLYGDTVIVRGDRRNRGEPRPGKLSGLTLTDKKVAEEFRRESWALTQLTEPHFKDKDFIGPWIQSLARRYRTNYRRLT